MAEFLIKTLLFGFCVAYLLSLFFLIYRFVDKEIFEERIFSGRKVVMEYYGEIVQAEFLFKNKAYGYLFLIADSKIYYLKHPIIVEEEGIFEFMVRKLRG